MFKINSYRPGAGLMTIYLAFFFSGLYGVGKTVLINKLQNLLDDAASAGANN